MARSIAQIRADIDKLKTPGGWFRSADTDQRRRLGVELRRAKDLERRSRPRPTYDTRDTARFQRENPGWAIGSQAPGAFRPTPIAPPRSTPPAPAPAPAPTPAPTTQNRGTSDAIAPPRPSTFNANPITTADDPRWDSRYSTEVRNQVIPLQARLRELNAQIRGMSRTDPRAAALIAERNRVEGQVRSITSAELGRVNTPPAPESPTTESPAPTTNNANPITTADDPRWDSRYSTEFRQQLLPLTAELRELNARLGQTSRTDPGYAALVQERNALEARIRSMTDAELRRVNTPAPTTPPTTGTGPGGTAADEVAQAAFLRMLNMIRPSTNSG